MKENVIFVSKDKCPLDVIADIGNQPENTWIFFDQAVFEYLKDNACTVSCLENTYSLFWRAHGQYSDTRIRLTPLNHNWLFCNQIDSKNVYFSLFANDPSELLFIKMQ